MHPHIKITILLRLILGMIDNNPSSMHCEYHEFYAVRVYLRSIRISFLSTNTFFYLAKWGWANHLLKTVLKQVLDLSCSVLFQIQFIAGRPVLVTSPKTLETFRRQTLASFFMKMSRNNDSYSWLLVKLALIHIENNLVFVVKGSNQKC